MGDGSWRGRRAALVIARRRVVAAGLLAAAASLALAQPKRDDFGGLGGEVPWVPTPDEMLDIMLRLARVGPRDLVCDLGSGDGRIPIYAARRYGARGIGIEIDPGMVSIAWRAAQAAGVADRVRFIEGDLFATDFSMASVVTLYLMTNMNDRLRPKLLAMAPGTRIVAHNFGMNDWDADEVVFHNETRALLWIVPAKVEGPWRVVFDGSKASQSLALVQRYQNVSGELYFGNTAERLRDASLRGDRLRFAAVDPQGALWSFQARVSGDRLRGVATDGIAIRRFTAARAG